MKKYLWLVVVMLMAAVLGGCGAGKAIEEAKVMLDDFYDAFSDEDYDEVLEMMHPELIEDIGEESEVQALLGVRRALLGRVDEYTIKNTSFTVSNGITEVTFTVDTEYDNGEQAEEELTFYTEDDRMQIVAADMPDIEKPVTTEIVQRFFDGMGDGSKMAAAYLPEAKTDSLDEALDSETKTIMEWAGAYNGYSLKDEQFVYEPVSGTDAVMVYLGNYQLDFDQFDVDCEIGISYSNDELGVSTAHFTASDVNAICEAYYKAVAEKDVNTLADMYSPVFYDVTQGGREAWVNDLLTPLVNECGAFLSYELNGWEIQVLDLPNGEQSQVFVTTVISEYENLKLNEVLTIRSMDSGLEILGHQMAEAQ